jgi:hypothetical protein
LADLTAKFVLKDWQEEERKSPSFIIGS